MNEDREIRGPWFTALYSGWCDGCNEKITPGDKARYIDGELACETCGDREDDLYV